MINLPRMLRFLRLALTVMAMTMVIEGTVAQPSYQTTGILNATAEGAIPNGSVFDVRAESGGPDTQDITDLIRDGLEDAGFKAGLSTGLGAGPQPDHKLRFKVAGDSPSSRAGSRLYLRGSEGSSRSSGDVELKMRWKATSDKTTPRPPPRPPPDHCHI